VAEACDHLKAALEALRGLLDVLREVADRDPDFDLAQAYHRHRSQVEAHFLAALSCTYHPALRMVLDVLDVLPLTLHEAARRVSWFRGGIGVVVPEHRDLLVIVPQVVELVMQAAADLGCPLEPPPEEARPDQERLTGRDRRCLELWREGRSLKEIAQEMGVGPETVRGYILRLRKRLGPDRVPYRRPR
jgi:DNA-binding CsgD family transcriptional regulator